MSDEGLNIAATVVGDLALKQRFKDFNSSVRVAMRTKLANIGQWLRDAEDAAAPRKTGTLGDTTISILTETDTTMTETVRPTAFYARFVSGGVVNHGTRNNKRETLGSLKKKRFKIKAVNNANALRQAGNWRIKPNDYIAETWQPMQAEVQAELATTLADAVRVA